MMQRCQQPLLLLCLTAVVAINIMGFVAETVQANTLFLTNNSMEAIPYNEKGVSVTVLVIKGTLITLNETDQQALASYPTVEELHLDHNHVATVPAKFFSVLPHLRVLSLSRNNMSCVHPEAFNGLDVLTELDLSQNMLTSLPTQLIRGIHSLQVLNLQENPWNCSCPLLIGIGEVTAANISIVTPQAICASPEEQAGKDLLEVTAMCYPSTLPNITTNPPEQPTPLNSQQSWGSSPMLKTTVSSSQNKSGNNDQAPVLGNTWKFTACVVALALTTSILIVCAIKGPSWYKLFHNYRHRRLREDEDYDGDNVASTSFSETRRYRNHQTFTFQQNNRDRDEEEEDGYFEDPYIKREE